MSIIKDERQLRIRHRRSATHFQVYTLYPGFALRASPRVNHNLVPPALCHWHRLSQRVSWGAPVLCRRHSLSRRVSWGAALCRRHRLSQRAWGICCDRARVAGEPGYKPRVKCEAKRVGAQRRRALRSTNPRSRMTTGEEGA